MSIKTNFFLMDLLVPLMALANISNNSVTNLTKVNPFMDSRIKVTEHAFSPEMDLINKNIKVFSEDLNSSYDPIQRVTPSQKSLYTEIENIDEVKLWPVQVQIKGMTEEIGSLHPCYCNSTSCKFLFDFELEGDIMTFMVPEGLNDLLILFSQSKVVDEYEGYKIRAFYGDGYYIIEDVEVGSATPLLYADITECRAIPVEIQMGNGESPIFPTIKYEGWNLVEVSRGNIISGGMDIVLYNSKYDYFMAPFQQFKEMPVDYDGFEGFASNYWNIQVNKVSDKWVLSCTGFLMDLELNSSIFAWTMTPNTDNIVFSQEDYIKVPWKFDEDPQKPLKGFSFISSYSLNNQYWYRSTITEWIEALCDHKVDLYLANRDFRVNNNAADWNLSLEYSAAYDVEIDEEYGEFTLYGIRTPKYRMDKKDGVYMPETNVFSSKPFEGNYEDWPVYDVANWGVQEFNYDQTQLGMDFNASAPYVVTYFGYEGEHDSDKVFKYFPESVIYGLAGENRNSVDWAAQKYTVTFNGEPVSGQDISLYDFIDNWNPSEAGDGILTMNVKVDTDLYFDGIQAKNYRTITLHQGAKDWSAPTLTCLQLRDNNFVVTNKFDNVNEGHILLSASDIYPGTYWEYIENWDFWMKEAIWYEVIYGAQVQVEITPCGQDAWEELEVEYTGQKNPALGDFYEVALNQITTPSDNGWYDLRITVTDKTGNSQQQTITPAFYVKNEVSGIQTIDSSCDASVKAIYNVSGIQLKDLQPGLNIVVYSDGTCRKVMMK